MARPAEEPIRQSVTVGLPADEAFAAFADLARWWPREYTWAGDTLEDIGIDPREDGFCFERGPRAFPRHGDAADTYRHALASPEGWPHIVARLP